jgi:16S rRNA (guanine966-N2)-methyltransferase
VTRIVGGVAGGRTLAVPSARTRPTSDRAREGLFSTLAALAGSLEGRRFLDLYAGSGAVGLEALSRGAGSVTLVESDPRAAAVIRANIAAVGLPGATLVQDRVERFVAGAAPSATYDIAFLDPPYATSSAQVADVIRELLAAFLTVDALLVVERGTRDPTWAWPPGSGRLRERRYGEGTLWYGRAGAQPSAEGVEGPA